MREDFEHLYETYHHQLFQYLFYMVRNREIAEELVQEVYIKVLKSYRSFKGKSSEKTWLYSIAKHIAIDWIRSQNRKKRKWEGKQYEWSEREFEIKDPSLSPEEIIQKKAEMQEVYHMLKKCTIDQQQVIIFRYIQELSIQETAEILGWTVSKVKTTQHRAIKALKEMLNESDHFKVKEASE